MTNRLVGKTGIKVSNLCFGTMSFGGNADKQTSKEMFHLTREAGINFFDTANVYSQGRSEEILGECISNCRNEVIISSKVGFPVGENMNSRGASRRHIFQAVEDSLRRLKTDRIEFYFIHLFDPHTDIEETILALDDLQRQGKILYPAVSNWSAWQIMKALGISARKGLARFELIQPMYNLVKRQAEVELFPLAEEEQLGIISYSPLGGGLLSGKYNHDNLPAQGRLIELKNYARRYGTKQYYTTTEQFIQLAQEYGYHPVSLAIAWVLRNPVITAPIIGARSVEQLQYAIRAREVHLSDELYEAITNLSEAPPLSTDHSREEDLFKGVKL